MNQVEIFYYWDYQDGHLLDFIFIINDDALDGSYISGNEKKFFFDDDATVRVHKKISFIQAHDAHFFFLTFYDYFFFFIFRKDKGNISFQLGLLISDVYQ